MSREFMELNHQREPVESWLDVNPRDRGIASNIRAGYVPAVTARTF